MRAVPDPSPRYHGLDRLRAAMMLLGLVVHACWFYATPAPPPAPVRWQADQTSRLCDVGLFGIHTFRMQVFFVMAGFFAAMLCARRGAGGMLRDRLRRVGLPLAVSWPVLFAGTISAVLVATARSEGVPTGAFVAGWIRSGSIVLLASPAHLWFLYFLLYFYAAAVALRWAGRRLGPGFERRLASGFRGLIGSPWRVPVLATLTFLTLLPSRSGMFPYLCPMFLPNVAGLVAYGLFFAVGWLLFEHADLLPRLRGHAWRAVAVGSALVVPYLGVIWGMDPATVRPMGPSSLALAALGAPIAWLMTFGLIGLSLRHGERPSPAWRHVADASYWVYLVHLPAMMWLQVALAGLAIPPALKAALVLVLTTPPLLLSYHLFVRDTAIGQFLHGRRQPAPWPRPRLRPPTLPLPTPGLTAESEGA